MKTGTIIVTGASRGIGAAIALELARRGFTVGCISRSGELPESAEPLAENIRGRLVVIRCDVTDEAAVVESFSKISKETGGIRGLVNNAGIHNQVRASELSTAEFERIMKVNTTAVFAACREVYPHLVQQKRGIIVNVGSFFDRLGVKGYAAYCASKAAVSAITRCMAAEWGRQGITVLNVAPGYIVTDFNREFLKEEINAEPIKARSFVRRPGEVAEVARLIAALYVEDIPFLTGETIYIDGGHGLSL